MNKSYLSNLKCEACSGETAKLSNSEISENLKLLDNWTINDDGNMIYKKFIFKNFKKSLEFANNIGKLADNERHHPDLSLGYSYCLVMMHTHTIKSLSINDFILASKIDIIKLK